jgi:aminoglycoside 6'-N-acetyltransferase I
MTGNEGAATEEPLVRVEPVRPEGTVEAERLLTRFFLEEGFPLPPGGLAARVKQYLSLTHHALFLASESSTAVGVATVTSNFGLEYGWAAELEDLYVVPERRGRGVARLLVHAAAEWARGDGCTSLLVTVTSRGEDAHHLSAVYRRLGFSDRGRKLLELDLDSR